MERHSLTTTQHLITRAAILEHAGDHAQAQTAWQEAEQIVASLPRGTVQVILARQLVKALAKVGHWQEAERVISSIGSEDWRERTIRSLAKACAKSGRWQEAERVTMTIPGESYRMIALRCLARDCAKARLFQDAERIASSITDVVNQAIAFHRIATALATTGFPSQAEGLRHKAAGLQPAVLSQPTQDWNQVESRRVLVVALSQAGLWQEAEEVALSIGVSWERREVLFELALVLTRKREFSRAHHVWQEYTRAVLAYDSSYPRDWMFERCIKELTHLRQWQEAEQMASLIASDPHRIQALQSLAAALARANHLDEAERIKTLASEVSSQATHHGSTTVESQDHQHNPVSFISWFKSFLKKLLQNPWFVSF